MNVRYQPKWGHLPTILVEFLPSMIWINQTGMTLFLSNETEAQMIETNDSLASKQWNHFKLDAKGRGTMFTVDKDFDIVESNSPAWIHSPTFQIPLNGQLIIDLIDGDTKVPIILESLLSRGIRQIIFKCPMKLVNRTKSTIKVTYGSFTTELIDQIAMPVTDTENIYFNDHKLPYNRSLSAFFVPVCSSPSSISDWITITRESYLYYIDYMTSLNPPRYTFHNQTDLLLSIEEQSIIMELKPNSTLLYESFQEMSLYPGQNQKPVKVRLCSEDGAGILHLTPGQWGVKLCKVKLTVDIVEMGRTRDVTIMDKSEEHKSELDKIEGSVKINRFELILLDDKLKRQPVLGMVIIEPYLSIYAVQNDFIVNFVLTELVRGF